MKSTTKNCTVRNVHCSECAQEGHKWTECKSEVKKCLNCGGGHRTLAMACPIKKEKIREKKERKEQAEKEKITKPYNEVIKKTVEESQSKATPTQLVLCTEHSYRITTCIIHAHFINMARPGPTRPL